MPGGNQNAKDHFSFAGRSARHSIDSAAWRSYSVSPFASGPPGPGGPELAVARFKSLPAFDGATGAISIRRSFISAGRPLIDAGTRKNTRSASMSWN
jgi:hypothetical protein